MSADPVFFRDLALVLLAAVIGGALAWLARQPLVLGYVLGGMVISPFTPGPTVSGGLHNFEAFAEIGVVLLMFSIGIEFSLKDLMRVKWVALVGGPLGTALSIGLSVAVSVALGWTAEQGLVLGVVVSVASTMVLVRLLLDRGELHTRHGRLLIGISLVEDLAVVVLLALMPALGAGTPDRLLALGRGLGIAALVLVPFVAFGARVISPLLARVARTRDEELFLLVALAFGLGTAALTQMVGLSLALGAFLAGLLISTSDFAHQTLARLLPLRDTFGAFFFVTIGALIDPRSVIEHLPLLGLIVALVVVGKLVVRAGVVWAFGEPPWTALLVGIGLAQIGEFSFVLVQAARQEGLITADVYQATLAASLLTILINAAMVRVAPRYVGALRLASQAMAEAGAFPAGLRKHVILCGYGRVGSAVAEALDTFRIPWVAIENDPDVVRGLRERGVPSVFGDAGHRRLLETAGARHAALAVVALPEVDRARLAVGHLRDAQPDPARPGPHARPRRAREAAGRRARPRSSSPSWRRRRRSSVTRCTAWPCRASAYSPTSSSFATRSTSPGRTRRSRPPGCPRCRRSRWGRGRWPTAPCARRACASASECRCLAITRADGSLEANPVGRHRAAGGRPDAPVRAARADRRAARPTTRAGSDAAPLARPRRASRRRSRGRRSAARRWRCRARVGCLDTAAPGGGAARAGTPREADRRRSGWWRPARSPPRSGPTPRRCPHA